MKKNNVTITLCKTNKKYSNRLLQTFREIAKLLTQSPENFIQSPSPSKSEAQLEAEAFIKKHEL